VSAVPWLIAAAEALALAAIGVSRWRKAGRALDAIMQDEPDPDEVEELRKVIQEVSWISPADTARGVLSAGYRRQRGDAR